MTIKRLADHIYYGIWIGPIEEVAESDREYDRILSVCQDNRVDNVSDNVPYAHFQLADDRESERNWGGSADYETFEQAVGWLREHHTERFNDQTTLVHCHNGKNRSVAVTAAYIAAENKPVVAVDDAIRMIQTNRPIADPNELMRSHAKRYVAEVEQ